MSTTTKDKKTTWVAKAANAAEIYAKDLEALQNVFGHTLEIERQIDGSILIQIFDQDEAERFEALMRVFNIFNLEKMCAEAA